MKQKLCELTEDGLFDGTNWLPSKAGKKGKLTWEFWKRPLTVTLIGVKSKINIRLLKGLMGQVDC